MQRSYEIVQGVIANSPNRQHLQAQQIKSPTLFINSSKPSEEVQKTGEKNSTAVQFVTPQNIASTSIQSQPIAVVKSVANGSNQSQSAGQRVFRSVALPFATVRSVSPYPQNNDQGISQVSCFLIPLSILFLIGNFCIF